MDGLSTSWTKSSVSDTCQRSNVNIHTMLRNPTYIDRVERR
ncbi:hypothetical protein Smp_127350 [Schistosoma mansoni]|nr:hypothetical protein Smp_127350 [Schistosoma mansoni]|eukprot:XP_018644938.1 hypothetical protein Smp_127350 [Schistosoma mansoni]